MSKTTLTKSELAKQVFSLEILSTVKTNQTTNGVKHGDYDRYSQYCTKRMHRIRKKLKFHHGARFKKKTIHPEIITDARYLELVLMMAERAWAVSMSLKDVDNDVNPRAKHHASRRLAKSSKWAQHLVLLCNARADQRTILEAESYSAWLYGNVLLENEQWNDALHQLLKAKTVYSELGKIGTNEQQVLCQERVVEIEPTIRYCKFNIAQEGGSIDTESLVKMKSETEANNLDLLKSKLETVLNDARKREAKTLKDIVWKGEKIPIKNEALRLIIVKVNDIISELQSIKIGERKRELYDRVQIQYSDAKKLISTESKKQTDQAKNLLYLEQYINFSIVEQTLHRNLDLVEELENQLQNDKKMNVVDEIVRAYELLIANVTDMKETKDFDEQGTKEFTALILSYKAIRCFYVGLSYLKAEKWLESIALFKRSEEQIISAQNHHDYVVNKDLKLIEKLENIKNQAIGNCTLSHAKGLMKQIESKKVLEKQEEQTIKIESEGNGTKLLINHQEEYLPFNDKERKLIQFPPNYEPISCKPLLLDVALEHVTFPDLSQRTVEQKKGFLSGWWG